jgi:hypothetical protein
MFMLFASSSVGCPAQSPGAGKTLRANSRLSTSPGKISGQADSFKGNAPEKFCLT